MVVARMSTEPEHVKKRTVAADINVIPGVGVTIRL